MLNNSENQSFFAGLKHAFFGSKSAEYSGKVSYVVTHMGVEKAYLLDKAENVEPEPVTELH